MAKGEGKGFCHGKRSVTGMNLQGEGIFKIAGVREGTRGGTETHRIGRSKPDDGLEGRGIVRMGTIG